MAREHEDYRHNIEQLNRLFPDREFLSVAEVKQITGYKSEDSVRRHYPITNGRICKVKLARLMCN